MMEIVSGLAQGFVTLLSPLVLAAWALGLVTGSLAYCLTVGDDDVAKSIWDPSLGGSYVVTPAMLRSDEPLLFSGPSHSKD